jgi:hypothetical protein
MDDDLREFLNFSDKDEAKLKPAELKAFMRTQLEAHEKQVCSASNNLSDSLFIN